MSKLEDAAARLSAAVAKLETAVTGAQRRAAPAPDVAHKLATLERGLDDIITQVEAALHPEKDKPDG